MRSTTLTTERWKLVDYASAGYGELCDVDADPEHFHNLWSDSSCDGVRRALTERLLAEIIDSELGDAAMIWRRQCTEPFGTLRDLERCEMVGYD